MTVDVDTTGAEAKIREAFGQVVDDGFTAMLADMENDAPRDTGLMTQTIEIDATDTDSSATRTIRAPQPYSSWQDEGVEGPIVPVRAKVLRFVAKDGTVVYTRSTRGVPRTGWWSDKVARLGDYLRSAMP